VGAGLGLPAVQQVLAEARLQAPGKGDHAFPVGRQLLEVDRRLPALKALQEPGGAELDQVSVPGRGPRQKRQVEAV
jgi:hypothetical protein